jgi:hypothetical protein
MPRVLPTDQRDLPERSGAPAVSKLLKPPKRRGKASPNPEDGPVVPTSLRRQFRPPALSPQPPAQPPPPKPAAAPAKQPKLKHDPKLVAAARELRDRWLEQVNAAGGRCCRRTASTM